jgi:hypothetical protein
LFRVLYTEVCFEETLPCLGAGRLAWPERLTQANKELGQKHSHLG